MAWESGFFNSVNGDRLYNADKFNEIFEGVITSGVFESVGNKLAVEPNSAMTVQVATGRGWFSNHWVNNSSEKLIVLEDSDVLLNRYAAVVVHVDESDSVRDVKLTVKYSSFASNPAKPSMIRSALRNEYCLAYVYIRAGATSIRASDIEDTRFNNELCGWVTGVIEQLDSDTLYNQWQDLFNAWFENLQDIIDENVEITLVNALPTTLTVTLSASGWDSSNTQSVTVPNMNSTKTVIVEPASYSIDGYSESSIQCTGQSSNTLTFRCESIPVIDLDVNIIHMGV